MRGKYNGSKMRAYKYFPSIKIKLSKLSKEAQQRLYWMDWYMSHGKNAELTCRHFGISKSVFYRWKNRFNKHDLSTLEGESSRPHTVRSMTTPKGIIDQVITIRREDPEKSKYEIQAELKEKGVVIGYNTIQKIINRHIFLKNTQHVKKVHRHRVYKIARMRAAKELKDKGLGTLVQIDTKHFYVLGQRYYIFAAIDCKSRYAYTYCYQTISSKSAEDFLQRVTGYFPFRISAVNTDNGSEYLKYFHALCEQRGIPHYFSYPHTPQMNSRVERLIQTLEYEFLNYQDALPEISEVRRLCEEFNTKYNQKRYHQALHYQTPQSYVTNYLQKGGLTVL